MSASWRCCYCVRLSLLVLAAVLLLLLLPWCAHTLSRHDTRNTATHAYAIHNSSDEHSARVCAVTTVWRMYAVNAYTSTSTHAMTTTTDAATITADATTTATAAAVAQDKWRHDADVLTDACVLPDDVYANATVVTADDAVVARGVAVVVVGDEDEAGCGSEATAATTQLTHGNVRSIHNNNNNNNNNSSSRNKSSDGWSQTTVGEVRLGPLQHSNDGSGSSSGGDDARAAEQAYTLMLFVASNTSDVCVDVSLHSRAHDAALLLSLRDDSSNNNDSSNTTTTTAAAPLRVWASSSLQAACGVQLSAFVAADVQVSGDDVVAERNCTASSSSDDDDGRYDTTVTCTQASVQQYTYAFTVSSLQQQQPHAVLCSDDTQGSSVDVAVASDGDGDDNGNSNKAVYCSVYIALHTRGVHTATTLTVTAAVIAAAASDDTATPLSSPTNTTRTRAALLRDGEDKRDADRMQRCRALAPGRGVWRDYVCARHAAAASDTGVYRSEVWLCVLCSCLVFALALSVHLLQLTR